MGSLLIDRHEDEDRFVLSPRLVKRCSGIGLPVDLLPLIVGLTLETAIDCLSYVVVRASAGRGTIFRETRGIGRTVPGDGQAWQDKTAKFLEPRHGFRPRQRAVVQIADRLIVGGQKKKECTASCKICLYGTVSECNKKTRNRKEARGLASRNGSASEKNRTWSRRRT